MQKMEYLVIDLRNNQGGYDKIANALCDLLTTDDLDHYAVGIRRNRIYKRTLKYWAGPLDGFHIIAGKEVGTEPRQVRLQFPLRRFPALAAAL